MTRICVLVLFYCFSATLHSSEAIVNGTLAAIESYPFIVSLQWDGQHKCGGTLLDATTVLTAAHCIPLVLVNTSQSHRVSVLLGSANQMHPLEPTARRVGVDRFIWHPSIPESQQGLQILSLPLFDLVYDYALVKLSTPVRPNRNIRFAQLIGPRDIQDEQGECTVLGWGRFSSPDTAVRYEEFFSDELRRGRMQKMSASECLIRLAVLPPDDQLPSTMACMGAIFRRGHSQGMLCFGDSGSPVLCNGRISGIVEAAPVPCNAPRSPVVVMRIQPILPWIRANLDRRPRRRCLSCV